MSLVNTLSTSEKILALQILMIDIRMSWGRRLFGRDVKFKGRFIGWDTARSRKRICIVLVESLFSTVVVPDFEPPMYDIFLKIAGRLCLLGSGDDGRWLRAPYSDGGYQYLEHLHGLPFDHGRKFSWKERSKPFQILLGRYLSLPEEGYFYDF